MRRWLGASAVACSLVACGDISIGKQACGDGDASIGCAGDPKLGPTVLMVPFQEVSTSQGAPLPITWQLASPCVERCASPIELRRGPASSVWTLPRSGALPAITLVDANARSVTAAVGPPPDQAGTVNAVSIASTQTNTVLMHVQFAALTGSKLGPDMLYEVQPPSAADPAPSESGAIQLDEGRTALPRGVLDSPIGTLLFDDSAVGSTTLRMVDASGHGVHSNSRFPSFAKNVGTSAVQVPSGFALGANTGDTRNPSYGVTTVDTTLGFEQYVIVSDATWRGIEVQPWVGGDYVAVASSDLVLPAALPGAGAGNIDIMMALRSGGYAGYRLRRSCINALAVRGFSSDSNGTLYVSTVAGTEEAPAGLLCRIPTSPAVPISGPECWQAQPNMLLGQIIANDDGSLFAVLGPFDASGSHAQDQIVRIDLPQ